MQDTIAVELALPVWKGLELDLMQCSAGRLMGSDERRVRSLKTSAGKVMSGSGQRPKHQM